MKNPFILAGVAFLLLTAAPFAHAQNSNGNTTFQSTTEASAAAGDEQAQAPATKALNEQASAWAEPAIDSATLVTATIAGAPAADEMGATPAGHVLTSLASDGLAQRPMLDRAEATVLGIGTSDPRGVLDVAGSGDTYLVKNPNNGNGQALFMPGQVYLAPYSATTDVAYLQARRPNNTGSLALQLRTSLDGNSVDALRLNADGSAVFAGAVRAQGFTISDKHLVQNARPLTGALAGVLALNGTRYAYYQNLANHLLPAGEQMGLLAQELEKVYPELVSTDADGFKAVNYAQLTPVLVEAIKELAGQNAALRQQLANQKEEATAASASFEQRLRVLEASGARASAGR